MNVSVVGGGSWGTTVALLLAREQTTRLWVRSAEQAKAMSNERENRSYLPGVRLPPELIVTADPKEALVDADVVLMAVPSHGFRQVLMRLAPTLTTGVAVVSLAKGIEEETHLRMSEIIADVLPGSHAGVLTGPNLAREVAQGQPAASVVALEDDRLAQLVQARLHSSTFRVYTSTDVTGCEIAGAVKNVIAIAAGMSDGLGFGENTRAALITRGLAELVRMGTVLGGQPLTFGGLAGVGDLIATCTSPSSRNRTVGFELGQGRTLEEVLAGMTMVAEGVKTAVPLARLAVGKAIEMPIVEQVAAIVTGERFPREALASLMDRPARAESDYELLRGLLD